ncbi:MAG: ABC transporter ATP-binding protein [Longibaculum muris]|uniref:ATP-binding cassette subfamily B protein n=1 Tax=Longibaculum muris TaxID=1796628 RepID=A0A4R3Z9F4_9FIRM|nr:ABC transporter ATP-binding protein [Longibaculum muris]KXU45154.1 ABC transporter, ATP-binding protein [Candidatus Stoquefichus sp. KLE1796]MBS5368461.1 ABC transporter ATP-binding protein [Coprobacillus cateniformis]MCR1888069.1 ABC transporter ATP-binding protein/permease [Longibaculum muris]MED9810596.1 ABC transporter ATP-binding protein [Longibaculum muris]TCW00932.1 ATP-binding cassette subfamily B protein [Longibaculum muris]
MKGRFRKFISYYKPYKKIFILDMVCAMLAAGVTLVFPMITRYITGVILVAEPIELGKIYQLGLLMLVLVVIEFFCNFYVTYQGHVMGTYMERDIRNELFEHYQKLSFSFYDEQKTGQLMSRITNDIFSLTELYHHGPEDIVISLIKFVGAFIILSSIHLKLTLIVFAFIPVMGGFAYYYNKKMKKAYKRNKQRIGDINARIEDNLSGIRVVKSFANESQEMDKFQVENMNFVDSKRNSYLYMAKYHSGLGVFTSMITIAVIFFGALFISQEAITTPDLIAFVLYIANLIEPVKKLINFTEQFQEGATGFERFMEILEVQPDIQDKANAVELKDVQGHVCFEDVAFRYNDKSEYVLKHIQLDVQPGEYIALVGSSGVGKTTICSLLPRFYEVSEGRIMIDGQDIRDVKLASLRQNIGIVQQDVYLFAGTIMDNIRYGKFNATDEEVIEAAKKANAHEFIMALPEGYDTDCGQRGVKLSGGQKQRLSIARVFLKNPPILIFDEATSALDNESEHIVQESLESLAAHRTTFVIAHRLSTIKNAKRICVLTSKGIEEEGTHEELLAKQGQYAYLYNMQFKEN